MATQQLSNGNDFRTLVGGNIELDLDGLGGVDTLDFGTEGQGSFVVTKSADGAVHVDTVSGASQFLHATLRNWEVLTFGDGTRIDLTTFFGPATPPPVTATLNTAAQGKQSGNVSYALVFSESVTGLDASDFTVANGSVAAINGSGASYTVVLAPAAGTEGSMALTLKASSVTGAAGGTLANAVGAPAVAVDTKAPSLVSSTPANAATGVTPGSAVVLSFSEAIQKGSGSILLKDGGGNVVATYDVASSAEVSVVNGSTLSVVPSLAQSGQYTLEVPAGAIRDSAGNSLGSALSLGFGTSGAKVTIAGTNAADVLTGTAGNDVFRGGLGNDTIDGLAGTDVAVYESSRSSYTLKLAGTEGVSTVQDNRVFVLPGGDGTDSLTHVERLQFSDQNIALDLGATQAAGKAALMMAVATSLGPALLGVKNLAGLFINYFDSGASLADGANLLVATGIVAAFAGGSDNASLVKMVYADINGKAPDAATLASLVAPLNAGTITQGQWLADMAASQANQDHVQLTGLAQTGWSYVL